MNLLVWLLLLVLYALILAVGVWAILWLIDFVVGLFPPDKRPPPQLVQAIKAVVVLAAVIIAIIYLLGVLPGLPPPPWPSRAMLGTASWLA